VINEIESKSKKASENAKKRWSMQTQSERNAIKLNEIKQNKTKSNKTTLEKRVSEFMNSVISKDIDMNKEDKMSFVEYWTEPNKSGSKLRFEMEKTWDLGRRMKRWCNNGFNKTTKSKFPDYYNEFTYKNLDTNGKNEYIQHLKDLGYESSYTPNSGTIWRKKHI
jgi:hypothetical protein